MGTKTKMLASRLTVAISRPARCGQGTAGHRQGLQQPAVSAGVGLGGGDAGALAQGRDRLVQQSRSIGLAIIARQRRPRR